MDKDAAQDERPTNDDNSHNQSKDEEEVDEKDEEEKPEPESLQDRFLKLPKDVQQRVLNETLDKVRDKNKNKLKYNYHGYTPAPPGPNASKNSNNLDDSPQTICDKWVEIFNSHPLLTTVK